MDSEAFQALDADGDGVVSKDDLKKKLQQDSSLQLYI